MSKKKTLFFSKARIPLSSLVSYWKYENNGFDSVGSNNFNIIQNSYSTTSKIAGTASSIYSSDITMVNNPMGLNFTNIIIGFQDLPFSLSAWVNYQSISGNNNNAPIFSKRNNSATQLEYIFGRASTNPNNGLLAILNDDLNGGLKRIIVNGWTPSLLTWYHVVFVYDGNIGEIYINGVPQNATNQTIGSYSRMNLYTNNSFAVGSYQNSQGSPSFNGFIDEHTIWNTDLTSEQVLNIYNKGLLGEEKRYYKQV